MTMKQPEFISFKALYEYSPQEEEIELKIGDVCYVQKPIDDPKGWLTGLNARTKEHGRFPGTYCSILSNNTTIPLPPRPLRKLKSETKPKVFPINGHMMEKFHFVKPVWCNKCNYYIWGGDLISLKCSSCNLSAHIGCVQIYNEIDCDPSIAYVNNSIKESTVDIEDWSNDDVLEWMVAVHLHPYMRNIKESLLTGKDLKSINDTYLKSIGMTIDIHIKFFLLCINELLKPPPEAEKIRAAEIDFTENEFIETHNLYEHTFTSLQECSICHKSMFGIFRQGLMCAVCGIQCHRPCAYSGLQICYGSYSYARRPSDSTDPSFCCNFPSTFIPPVMLKCVARVEESGLDTPNIYDTDIVYYQCQALRSACNENINNTDLSDSYWSDPSCAAFVLKSFLMELPDPLLDLNVYERFCRLSEMNYTVNDVLQLLRQQKEHNTFQLDFVISHLLRVLKNCEVNNMTLDRLASIFSILLVRPPEHEARKFISNWEAHEKIVTMILLANQTNVTNTSLNIEPWLWENATKKEAQLRLSGTPDGSFLVRESEKRRGQYTLTVQESGTEHLIRIIEENGRYGFSKENLMFSNLRDLIEHFKVHSLGNYNEKLNTKLIYPCGKPVELQPIAADNDEEIKEKYDEVDKKLKQIKLLEFEKEDKLNMLEECKIMSESQTDIVRFLEEQISLAEQQHYEASINDKPDIQSSLSSLNDLLSQEKSLWSELDDQLLSLKHECNLLNTKLTELSPELPTLEEEYKKLHTKIKRLDEKRAEASEKEDWKGIYDDPSVLRNENRNYLSKQYSTQDMEDLEEKDWLFGYLDESVISRMLSNKPNGTFFVRKSSNYPYVISLVYENSILKVPILRGPNGFGFAEPHNVYTLPALINHYHNQSLRMHNNKLDTTLKTPYRFFEQIENEPVYT